MKVDKKEVFRYLGYGGREVDLKTEQLADSLIEKLPEIITPRFVLRELPLTVTDESVIIDKYNIKSANLRANLKGCKSVVLFAATLGREADTLVKRCELTSIAKAAVAQAVLSAATEAYCDEINEKIRSEKEGLFLRPRFSAGYGDFLLEYQEMFFELLDITKKIGVTLTNELLMVPTKSVTALIGISDSQRSCNNEKCGNCNKKECEFRYGY